MLILTKLSFLLPCCSPSHTIPHCRGHFLDNFWCFFPNFSVTKALTVFKIQWSPRIKNLDTKNFLFWRNYFSFPADNFLFFLVGSYNKLLFIKNLFVYPLSSLYVDSTVHQFIEYNWIFIVDFISAKVFILMPLLFRWFIKNIHDPLPAEYWRITNIYLFESSRENLTFQSLSIWFL